MNCFESLAMIRQDIRLNIKCASADFLWYQHLFEAFNVRAWRKRNLSLSSSSSFIFKQRRVFRVSFHWRRLKKIMLLLKLSAISFDVERSTMSNAGERRKIACFITRDFPSHFCDNFTICFYFVAKYFAINIYQLTDKLEIWFKSAKSETNLHDIDFLPWARKAGWKNYGSSINCKTFRLKLSSRLKKAQLKSSDNQFGSDCRFLIYDGLWCTANRM